LVNYINIYFIGRIINTSFTGKLLKHIFIRKFVGSFCTFIAHIDIFMNTPFIGEFII